MWLSMRATLWIALQRDEEKNFRLVKSELLVHNLICEWFEIKTNPTFNRGQADVQSRVETYHDRCERCSEGRYTDYDEEPGFTQLVAPHGSLRRRDSGERILLRGINIYGGEYCTIADDSYLKFDHIFSPEPITTRSRASCYHQMRARMLQIRIPQTEIWVRGARVRVRMLGYLIPNIPCFENPRYDW